MYNYAAANPICGAHVRFFFFFPPNKGEILDLASQSASKEFAPCVGFFGRTAGGGFFCLICVHGFYTGVLFFFNPLSDLSPLTFESSRGHD